MYIISNFLVLHYGENFMKIQTNIAKPLLDENLHKNVNENIKATNTVFYSFYTANFLYGF